MGERIKVAVHHALHCSARMGIEAAGERLRSYQNWPIPLMIDDTKESKWIAATIAQLMFF